MKALKKHRYLVMAVGLIAWLVVLVPSYDTGGYAPVTAAPAFPADDNLVKLTCQNELRAHLPTPELHFVNDFVDASNAEPFKVYATTVLYSDRLPREETWVCRYYADWRVELEQVPPL